MKRSVLYFPYIVINDSPWLRNALLYWDEICSIVPTMYGDPLSNEIQYLEELGFYRNITPDCLYRSSLCHDFEAEIKKRISLFESFRLNNEKIRKGIPAIGIEDDNRRLYELIHYGKLSSNLTRFLRENNFISEYSEDWHMIDSKLGYMILSIMAKYLAVIDKNHTVTGTDVAREFDHAYPNQYPCYKAHLLENNCLDDKYFCLTSKLIELLPSPVQDVPFESIIDFKRKHKDDLLCFRRVLDDYHKQLSECGDVNDICSVQIRFKEQLEIETKKVEKMLRGSRIGYILASATAFLAMKTPDIATTFWGELSAIPNPHLGLSLLTNSAITVGSLYLNYKVQKRSIKENTDFSYLMHAKKAGIVL